jgi:hypothetical protein
MTSPPGTESAEALAQKYDVVPATVYAFKERKKAQIAAVVAEWV